MNDTTLDLCIWESRLNGLSEACQTVHAEQKYILNPTGFEFIQHIQPEFTILQEQKSQQEERADIMGDYYFKSDYVCTWADGKVIQPNYLTKQFHKILKESDLPMVRLHDLRHSTASNLLDKNSFAVQVGDWLGHSSPATTLNFYAHDEITNFSTVLF